MILFQGEALILNGFPKKIVQLNELIKLPDWNEENLSNLHEDINIPIPEPVIVNKYVRGFVLRFTYL